MRNHEESARKAAAAAALAAFTAKRMTRKGFAEQIGVNVDTVSDFLAGKQLPQTENQGKIEGGLGLPFGSIQQAYDAALASGTPSDRTSMVTVEDGEIGVNSGDMMLFVHVAAMGVDFKIPFVDADDRARALSQVMQEIQAMGAVSGAGSVRPGSGRRSTDADENTDDDDGEDPAR